MSNEKKKVKLQMKRIGVDMFRHKETILGCFILEHSVQYSRNNR